jgi:hypothetical protein
MVASFRIANVRKNTPFTASNQRANIETDLLLPVSSRGGGSSGEHPPSGLSGSFGFSGLSGFFGFSGLSNETSQTDQIDQIDFPRSPCSTNKAG